MKALDYLYRMKQANEEMGQEPINIIESIKEIEALHKKIDVLKEYVKVAHIYIEFYRCKCGALGRVGYLCSNVDCTEE